MVVTWRRTVCLILAVTAWIATSCSSPTSPGSPSNAPQMNAVQPPTGSQGDTVQVTLTGTNFTVGDTAAVAVTGNGVTVSNVTVQSPTTAAAALTIANNAPLGPRTLTLTTATGGTSPALTFTVVPPAPTLTAISPTTAAAGSSVTLTLTGTNFVSNGTSVEVSGADVSAGDASVRSSTSLTVILRIGSGATGDHDVTVKTAGGTSGGRTITITAPAPSTIASFAASPSSITSGQSSTLSWSGIGGASTCSIDQGVGSIACGNGSTTVSPASTTTYTLTATGAGGTTTATATVSVAASAPTGGPAPAPGPAPSPAPAPSPGPAPAPPLPAMLAPTLASISPNSGRSGDDVNVSLTGTNFVVGQTSVAVSSRDVSVGSVVVRSSTSLTARFNIKKHADSGHFDVTVTTPGGTSNAVSFSVTESHDD